MGTLCTHFNNTVLFRFRIENKMYSIQLYVICLQDILLLFHRIQSQGTGVCVCVCAGMHLVTIISDNLSPIYFPNALKLNWIRYSYASIDRRNKHLN